MAKILEFKGKIPRWIFDEFVIYLLDGEWIIREKSGFNRKELLTAAKYENCRKNASEFGILSKACKGLRMALEGILPKKNNLGIVNSLTKHMRSLLAYDSKHLRGERKLATALADAEGLRLFKGYSFTPDTPIEVRTQLVDGYLKVQDVKVPKGTSWVGFRLHVMEYDWELFEGELHSSDWHFEKDVADGLLMELPEIDGGDLIYLLEVQGFAEKDGEFVGVDVDEKGVFVVDYLPCLPSKLHFDTARDCRGVSLSRNVGIETTRIDGAIEAIGCDELLNRIHDKASRDDVEMDELCVSGLPAKLHFEVARGCRGVSLSRSVGIKTTRNDSAIKARGSHGVSISRSVGFETTSYDSAWMETAWDGILKRSILKRGRDKNQVALVPS